MSVFSSPTPSDELYVATIDGIFLLRRDAEGRWNKAGQLLAGYHVCSLVIEPTGGAMIAGTHNGGVAISRDQGANWSFCNEGLGSLNVFSVATSNVAGEVRLYAGTEPAHLYVSDDFGASWLDLKSLRDAPNLDDWTFPPPPHEAHVKHITFDPFNPDCIYVSVEQGELMRSDDAGATWEYLLSQAGVCKAAEGDAHRLILRPQHPNEMFMPTGFGLFFSEDNGKSWRNIKDKLPWIGYPDPMVYDPRRQNLLFVAGGQDDPGNWIGRKNARASVARSRDGGRTWERMGGLPEGMTASIEAMILESTANGCAVYLGTTDGDVFCSEDDGESWTRIVNGLPSISKGVHFLLAKGLIGGGPPPQ